MFHKLVLIIVIVMICMIRMQNRSIFFSEPHCFIVWQSSQQGKQALIEAHWGRNHSAPCWGKDLWTGQLMTGLPDWASLKVLHSHKDLGVFF